MTKPLVYFQLKYYRLFKLYGFNIHSFEVEGNFTFTMTMGLQRFVHEYYNPVKDFKYQLIATGHSLHDLLANDFCKKVYEHIKKTK